MVDFAPYQSSPPEASRPFSPASITPRVVTRLPPTLIPALAHILHIAAASSAPPTVSATPTWGGATATGTNTATAGFNMREGVIGEFDTSLGDTVGLRGRACVCCASATGCHHTAELILERGSDYVRFHAWQSSLLFTVIFILHLVFSWSTFLSWVTVIADIALIVLLAMRVYRDADTRLIDTR